MIKQNCEISLKSQLQTLSFCRGSSLRVSGDISMAICKNRSHKHKKTPEMKVKGNNSNKRQKQ